MNQGELKDFVSANLFLGQAISHHFGPTTSTIKIRSRHGLEIVINHIFS